MKTDRPMPPILDTLAQALSYCHERLMESDVFFGHGTDNAWDEAVQMVAAVAHRPADMDQTALSQPFSRSMTAALVSLLDRRIEDKLPLPYLVGKAWFAGLELKCDQRAIIPRSPLAELILDDFLPWYSGPAPSRVLDLCCGGGCIGLATAFYQPHCQVDLLDLDSQALSLAQENANLLGLAKRCRILESDLFSAVQGERYDLILSNPPYVDASELAAMPSEYHAEPSLALGSGQDGLDITRRILRSAGNHLHPHGLLVLEVGHSWPALESTYPRIPFTWLEFERGGEGVFAMRHDEWQDYSESWV